MTPQDIVDIVEARFPILLYQGYRLSETVPTDGNGDPILWPKELIAALVAYSLKAGIQETLYVKQADIDEVDYTIVMPTDFISLDKVQESDGTSVNILEGARGITNSTLKVLTLIPQVDLNEYSYPITLRYFMNLGIFDRDSVLPEECDVNLLIDYLESIVGIANSQMCAAMENLDLDLQQRKLAEYVQQKKDCEAYFATIRCFPDVSTG